MNQKTLVKNKKHITLYTKEQLIILFVMLCFVLSGFMLPKIKNYLIVDDNLPPTVSVLPEQEEPLITESENNDSDATISAENDVPKPEQEEVNQPEATPPTSDLPNPTTPSKQPDSSNSSNISNNSTSSSETSESDSSKLETSEKVWVPPVYETVHHEAVYETVRVVICNYCSETFDTVGEFQIHKNANGG